jgi:hypothetical protein
MRKRCARTLVAEQVERESQQIEPEWSDDHEHALGGLGWEGLTREPPSEPLRELARRCAAQPRTAPSDEQLLALAHFILHGHEDGGSDA